MLVYQANRIFGGIQCPHCNEEVDISKEISHQIQDFTGFSYDAENPKTECFEFNNLLNEKYQSLLINSLSEIEVVEWAKQYKNKSDSAMITPVEIAQKLREFIDQYTGYTWFKTGPHSMAPFLTLVIKNEIPENDEHPYYKVENVETVHEILRNMRMPVTDEELISKANMVIEQSGVSPENMYITVKYVNN